MEMSKLTLLPLSVKILGEDLNFRVNLNKIDDDYQDWILFKGDYAEDEGSEAVISQEVVDGDSEGAVKPVTRQRTRTSTELILRLVADWELTDDGAKVPVNEAVVSELNLTVKNIIVGKILETLDAKKLSAAPSHFLATSARRAR